MFNNNATKLVDAILIFYFAFLCDPRLTHLALRNNRIGEEGARLIGSALSTVKSANKNLLALNLAFNNIGDAGAVCIAQVCIAEKVFGHSFARFFL